MMLVGVLFLLVFLWDMRKLRVMDGLFALVVNNY